MDEQRPRAYTVWDLAVYTSSVIAILTFMFHFWWPLTIVSYVLWGASAFFAIFSIYGGVIGRSVTIEPGPRRGMASAAAVIGCLVVLGLTISAANLLVLVTLTLR